MFLAFILLIILLQLLVSLWSVALIQTQFGLLILAGSGNPRAQQLARDICAKHVQALAVLR